MLDVSGDCDLLKQLQDSSKHPRKTFWKTAREARTTYHIQTQEPEPISLDTLSFLFYKI